MRAHIGIAAASAALALTTAGAPLAAQPTVPGDPFGDDPVGILVDPCPQHPAPQGDEWRMWQLHMLTRDFGQLCRYRAANAELTQSGAPVRVVFMGDSITDNWDDIAPDMWADGRIDRGIGGQTTPQMLVRFRQDVIDLHPQAVHIMAGTNDIAGNTGAATIETVQGNIRSMAELARAHGIKVIIGSIPPAGSFPWAPDQDPVPMIRRMNAWLQQYAADNGFTYVDYFDAMATPAGAMRDGLSSDGVHPTKAGYAIMKPLALAAIERALKD